MEDLLPVDGGRWLIRSSYQAGSTGLYLIDTAAHTAHPVSLSVAREPDPQYRGCAAPDLKTLVTHGLDVVPAVVPARGAPSTVYAVNHGGRESVEVLRLFVNAYGSSEIYRVPLSSEAASTTGRFRDRISMSRVAANDHKHSVSFTPQLRLKDVEYALSRARKLGIGTPFGSVAAESFLDLCSTGFAQLNESAVIEIARRRLPQGKRPAD